VGGPGERKKRKSTRAIGKRKHEHKILKYGQKSLNMGRKNQRIGQKRCGGGQKFTYLAPVLSTLLQKVFKVFE
jgi:hypothetical protein